MSTVHSKLALMTGLGLCLPTLSLASFASAPKQMSACDAYQECEDQVLMKMADPSFQRTPVLMHNPHLNGNVLKTLCQFALMRAGIVANPYGASAGRVQVPKPAKVNKRLARVQRRVKLFNLTGRHLSEKDARAIVARHIPNDALVGIRHQSANWQEVLAGAQPAEGKATIVIVRHESFPVLAEDDQFQMLTIDLGAA